MTDIAKVADDADMIVNGYAFTKAGQNIRILNLNNPNRAAVINKEADVIETNMDDIEIVIVTDYYNRNKKYMEI